MNQKKILIIAGGEWQIPIIKKAKEMGLFVINTNIYPNSPGFQYADISYVADVLDTDKNLYIAQKYDVDAVITDQSDIAVPTVAYICEKLGLPGIGSNIANNFTNKSKMRDICYKNNFPTPKYRMCSTLKELIKFSHQHPFPLVVKPPASQSSRGVSKVNSPSELKASYNDAIKYSSDGSSILVEQFISGKELTIDGIQVFGKHHCLATSKKIHYPHNPMVASRLTFGHDDKKIDLSRLHEQHNSLIKIMGLTFGLTHAEYIYSDGQFYLVEVAARGGGTNLSSSIVPLMSGIDSNELLIRMSLGERINRISRNNYQGVAIMDFFEFPEGHVQSINGAEKITKMQGVLSSGVSISPGEIIHKAVDDRSRHGYVIAHSDSLSKVENILSHVKETIDIHYA